MKPVRRLPEPQLLTAYRVACPNCTWDQMRDDAFNGGQGAYRDIKTTLVKGQRCLCAFCEVRIAPGMAGHELDVTKSMQRVEHFHPKEDLTQPPNWALHWPNLLAVCLGGSQRPPAGEPIDINHYLEPLPDNLSCDAFKDHQITSGRLASNPEGWILAPDELPPFPLLVQFSPDGTPEPDHQACASWTPTRNNHADSVTLVARTIEHLNLGCERLKRRRCIVKAQLEKRIQKARQHAQGRTSDEVLMGLARQLFSANIDTPWPEFFSLIRWRLGMHAESHLMSLQFAG